MQMQQATHPRLHVRDAHDAHVVFEAVRQGFLRPVARRLTEKEREMHVRSGAIFVWFECEEDAGLKRWTDGRVWGQSRMREPYLFYDEKVHLDLAQGVPESTNRPPTFRFVDGASRSAPLSSAISHQDRTANQHPGLVKQAYSAWVYPNPAAKPQKWHLTAYFTYNDLPNLPTIDHDPMLRNIIVPSELYRNGKAKSKSDEEASSTSFSSNGSPSPSTNHPRHHDLILPSLPSLQSTLGPRSSVLPQPRAQSARLPEDQRVIQILNSKHVR